MNVKTFIDRPILAGVISVLILIVGLISLIQLPLEQFPDIAPPTISVSASYSGANSTTLQRSVVVPLEEAINGVENMTYMTSSSTNNGSASIQVFFKQGTNPDMAIVNVQNRIASAQGLLPAEVTKSGVTVRRRQTSTLKSIGLYCPNGTYDNVFLNNYFKINIEPQLSRIAGVGEVDVNGADYSMRIWLRPDKMAKYGLVPADITTVLNEQNIEAATGTLGMESENTFQYILKYRGRYEKESDFENLVVRALPDGNVLRVKDIARVELGQKSYEVTSEVNGKPGAMCMISQTPGSNANEIIIEIDKLMDKIRKELPKDMVLVDLQSSKDFLDASIKEVTKTLLEAILLVILVVYIFLQSFRSTIIPAIAIIVSLIGTFAFLYLVNFSLNTLTLFALVLVIGTVVDDAIVVVEAVQAKFDEGYKSPYTATIDAMHGITSALITTSLVFLAVFIPVCFMGGTTGVFYKQLGLTMGVAVCISTLNALTLSPALCALIMTPHLEGEGEGKLSFSSRFHIAFNASFNRIIDKYAKAVSFFFKRKWLISVSVVFILIAFAFLIKTTKTGLVPEEDMGSIYVSVQCAPGSSKSQTNSVLSKIEKEIVKIEEIKSYSKVIGVSRLGGQGASNGMFVIRLKPWGERTKRGSDQSSIISRIYKMTSSITEAKILANSQPMISGYGKGSGFELYIQDRKGGDVEDLLKYTRDFLGTLGKREEIGRAQTTFDTKYPQYLLEVDAVSCKRNNVSPNDVLSALSGYVGGNYASNMNRFSKLYRVMVQADAAYRLDKESLNNLFVRNSKGEMSPIGQYITLTRIYGAENLTRFNLFSAIAVNGSQASGYSTGQAIEAIREVAEQTLPEGYGYEFAGMSREESSANNTTVFVFAACIVFIYLILCGLYESLFIPMAVILSIPFGLTGSFIFARLFGIENNIYMQIGVIMLIGLLAKTAILLTEYASERRKEGMSIAEASMSAARVRLRPILMTSLTLVFGLLPMIFATGAGANGTISLAVGTVGGMLIGTISLLFVVPVLFIVFQTIEERVFPKRKIKK